MSSVKKLSPESKTQSLAESLRELAYQLGAEEKFPTAVELCEQFHTSRATLNDALNILESQHVIYRKRGSGIYVSPRLHTKCICVLLYASLFLGKDKSPFWGILSGLIAEEMERRAESHAYHCELHFVLRTELDQVALPESVIELIQAKRIHGIITVGMNHLTTAWLQQQGIPCVVYAGYGPYRVSQDGNALLRQAVSLLALEGCQRPGLWMEATCLDTENEPLLARSTEQLFSRYLSDYNLPFDPLLVHYDVFIRSQVPGGVPSLQQQGYIYAMKVFSGPAQRRPDGIFIDNDMVTMGALAALQRLGIRIGEDVCIVTQANTGSPILFGYEDRLRIVEFDPAELVHEMFTMLDSLLRPGRPDWLYVQIQPRSF